ncbi:MAG TPA: PQQ-binding-like beta-propeller repeat protein [Terracidiphilus sp.]|jgi:outer membrane protein assembly factor BamB
MVRLAAVFLLFALGSNTGTLLWEARPGGRDLGGMAESNGVLLAGNVTSVGGIFAFNSETGKLLWQHRGEQMRGVISSDGQRAFATFHSVNTNVRRLVAYDLKTGKQLWQVTSDDKLGGHFATVVDGGRVYLMSENGHVDAYNTATGARLWDFTYAQHDAKCLTGMVLANGRLIFGGGQSYPGYNFLWAIDPVTGKELWKYQSHLAYSGSIDCYATPAISGDTIVLTTGNFVMAVSASNRTVLWTGKEGVSGGYPKPYPLSAPVIVSDMVFAARSGALSSWSLATGKPLPDVPVLAFDASPEQAHLATLDSTLFFLGDLAVDSGKPGKTPLHAMDANTRRIVWTHRVNRQSQYIQDWPTHEVLPTPTAVFYENNGLIAKVSR